MIKIEEMRKPYRMNGEEECLVISKEEFNNIQKKLRKLKREKDGPWKAEKEDYEDILFESNIKRTWTRLNPLKLSRRFVFKIGQGNRYKKTNSVTTVIIMEACSQEELAQVIMDGNEIEVLGCFGWTPAKANNRELLRAIDLLQNLARTVGREEVDF